MGKRTIKLQILPDGEIKVDNAGNPDERRILDELGDLAELLTGNQAGYKVEKHVHSHGHDHAAHTHTVGTGHQ